MHGQGAPGRRLQAGGEQEARDIVELRPETGASEIDQPCAAPPEKDVPGGSVAVGNPERAGKHFQARGGQRLAGRPALVRREAKTVQREVAVRDQFLGALLPMQTFAQRQLVEGGYRLNRRLGGAGRRHDRERGQAIDPFFNRDFPTYRQQPGGKCEA